MLVLGALVVHRLARALGGAPRLVRQESVA